MHRASHFYAWLPVTMTGPAGSAGEQGMGAGMGTDPIISSAAVGDNDAAAMGRGAAVESANGHWSLELRQAHLDKLSKRLRGGSRGEVVLSVRLG